MITPVFPPTPESIQKVAALLKQGEVVALPTETVYGLAGNATSPSAVLKIFQAKERPSFDPLIVHVSDSLLKTLSPLKTLIDQKLVAPTVAHWVCAPDIDRTIKKFWPGPLTLILPKGSAIPNEVTSGEPTVGLRCPAHPLFQAVLSNLDFPLAAPSANRFGRISPTQASHVVEELDQKIAGILDGGTSSVGVESTIIRIEDPLKITLLRPGKIGVRELENQNRARNAR
jgi:L-threonylcarbamoyladenylate synthase